MTTALCGLCAPSVRLSQPKMFGCSSRSILVQDKGRGGASDPPAGHTVPQSGATQGFSVTRKYIFQLGGIAPFKGYAVFSCLSVSFCSVCGSVGKWISPTKLKIISTF